MALENLPSELLLLILKSIIAPQDLYHLISASPIYLQTFLQSPETISLSIIQNTVQDLNIHHLCAVFYAGTYIKQDTSIEEVENFLINYFTARTLTLPTSRSDLKALLRFCYRLSYFTDHYFKAATHLLQERASCPPRNKQAAYSESTEPIPPCSFSEKLRLQRAFLRYELYCRVFPKYRFNEGVSRRPQQIQYDLFLSHIKPWEAEEISCIYQYFQMLAEASFDYQADALVDAVLSDPGTKVPARSSRRGRRPEAESCGLVLFGHEMEETNLTLFSKEMQGVSSKWISGFISSGLELMYQVASTEEPARSELVRQNYPDMREFLPEALACSRASDPPKPRVEEVLDDNGLSHANLGYFMAHPKESDVYLGITRGAGRAHLRNARLREFGYVFWNSDRIKSPSATARLTRLNDTGDHDDSHRFYRYGRKSAQERLEGVLVTVEVQRAIIEKFGYPEEEYPEELDS